MKIYNNLKYLFNYPFSYSFNCLFNWFYNYSLKKILTKLTEKFNLTAVIGVELEFYMLYEDDFHKKITKKHISFLEDKLQIQIKPESSVNQFEVIFAHTEKIFTLIEQINNFKQNITIYAKDLGINIIFSPKPFVSQNSNSMHVNLSFKESSSLEFIENIVKIQCLLFYKYKKYFIQNKLDEKRLKSVGIFSPSYICYSFAHNRTSMIRIINNKINNKSNNYRLEHRSASSTANINLILYAILSILYQGLTNNKNLIKASKKYSPIYGNAYDTQYNLEKII